MPRADAISAYVLLSLRMAIRVEHSSPVQLMDVDLFGLVGVVGIFAQLVLYFKEIERTEWDDLAHFFQLDKYVGNLG